MPESRAEGKGVKATVGPDPARDDIRTVSAAELLGRAGVVRIEHQGEVYTLRRTRLGRLILTK